MSDYLAEIDRLREQAFALENGSTKIALLEETVRLADQHNDLDEGFHNRQLLIEAATFGGRPEISLVAFSWCLSQCDRHPDRFYDGDLLWQYKWIVNSLPEFPQISRDQIYSMLADLERRFQAAGSNLQPALMLRRKIAMRMGDRETAAAVHRECRRKPREWLSDCHACEMNSFISYLLFLGKYDLAIEKAAPIISGQFKCAEIPHATYPRLLFPLLRADRLAEAMEYHHKGMRLISRNPAEFVPEFGDHVTFLTLTDNLAKALKIFEKYLAVALAGDPRSQFSYLLAGPLLLDRLAEEGRGDMKIRLPADVPVPELKGVTRPAELKTWLEGRLQDLARRFDERNGNDYFRQLLKKQAQLKKMVKPYPLRPA